VGQRRRAAPPRRSSICLLPNARKTGHEILAERKNLSKKFAGRTNMPLDVVCRIPAQGIRSLVWHGDALVDWVAGGKCYQLDGTVIPRHVNYAYRFDAACLSPSGRYAVIYERLGTKGLVLVRALFRRGQRRSARRPFSKAAMWY
jgi:hypothetical protein